MTKIWFILFLYDTIGIKWDTGGWIPIASGSPVDGNGGPLGKLNRGSVLISKLAWDVSRRDN